MIIHLNENTLNRLFLIEGISDTTYHYCSIDSLYSILKDGDIKLTMSSNKADSYHKTKLFYLSTQRSKSLRFGYARNSHNKCRVELDGYQLKADGYEGMPLDYWGAFMGKQSDIGLNAPRVKTFFGNRFDTDNQKNREAVLNAQAGATNFEFEDRIFSETPSLPLKYIKRVDCLVNKIAPVDKAILTLAKDNGVNVFFYNSERDFILQTENVINKEILMSDGEFEEEPERIRPEYKERSAIDIIATLCGMLFYTKPHFSSGDYTRIESETMDVLSKFGLEKFYKLVIDKIPEKIRWVEEACSTMSDRLRKLNTDSNTKTNFSDNVMLLGQYVLNSYGVNNFGALRTYFSNYWNNKKENDRVVQDSVKCVMYSYWGSDSWDMVIGDRKFWEWFDKGQFYDEISRQLDNDEFNKQYGEAPVITHKSKTNESFKKYLQHIMHNDNLSLYDGSVILSKIYNNNKEKMEETFGRAVKPIILTKDNFFDYELMLNFSDRFDVEEKLFLNSKESWDYRQKRVSQS